ncbi:aspartyl protease family protein [Flavobacterium sp.]|uniref:aspartyl protease family protein n=1 Tax=Flavobacterium sp. TaxID=239 RepID=UPI003BE493CC
MKIKFSIVFFFIFFLVSQAQEGFEMQANKKRIVIPFKLIDNLIFIPLTVNGENLTFLLDTGAEETVLFSLEDQQLSLVNVEKIRIKGYDSSVFLEALKSTNNILSTGGYFDRNHNIYIILDQSFNLSSQVGIPVNGIIGYPFFKNYLVEINYEKEKIYIYLKQSKIYKKLNKKYSSYTIVLERNKPFLTAKIGMEGKETRAKLLLDSGNSNALWLYNTLSNPITIPTNNLDDYLGLGFSGEIYGKRARIDFLELKEFKFLQPIAAFPDSQMTQEEQKFREREGTLGDEILKRFSVFWDYPNSKIYLKRNSKYNLPFNYNMSGIEIQHDGLEWVKEEELINKYASITLDVAQDKLVNFRYKFSLKPVFKITSVRKNSPAAACGLLKDDVIHTINKDKVYRYSLQELSELLKSEEGKWITLEIERNNKTMVFKFQLQTML